MTDLPVDVREILYYLAVFDCSQYDEKKHPLRSSGAKGRHRQEIRGASRELG